MQFDEMNGADSTCRTVYAHVAKWLDEVSAEVLTLKRHEAELLFRRIGITFAVYGEGGSPERLIPFDLIPRIIAESEWTLMARGLEQRVRALNAFVRDCYHDREIIRAGKIPEQLILQDDSFVHEMQGFEVPRDVYCHIAGIDMVRVGPEEFFVLEDNCRTPSGVSYMLENREMSLRLLPELVGTYDLMSVSQYPEELLDSLMTVAPPNCPAEPTVAILTPGSLNSAYYEHSFLSDEMGIELVEGVDLIVEDAVLFMRTTQGLRRVDILYRRIDDDYLDPLAFNPDSVLGVPGLMAAYRAGNLTLANAVGAGIADNKAVYIYVPEMIRFYLGEEPILKNVPTYNCAEKDDLCYVLDNIGDLVVKEVHGSGGYGMLVGPKSTTKEKQEFCAKIKAHPEDYIAQPTLALSTCPTFVEEGVAPRHVDLRPFVLTGEDIRIVPGGLTRVALRDGSLVVNSSQGGGTKDTWVVRDQTGVETPGAD